MTSSGGSCFCGLFPGALDRDLYGLGRVLGEGVDAGGVGEEELALEFDAGA